MSNGGRSLPIFDLQPSSNLNSPFLCFTLGRIARIAFPLNFYLPSFDRIYLSNPSCHRLLFIGSYGSSFESRIQFLHEIDSVEVVLQLYYVRLPWPALLENGRQPDFHGDALPDDNAELRDGAAVGFEKGREDSGNGQDGSADGGGPLARDC
ncbi:hypothetical protein ACLOJK_035131 [Asimina triloba]